MNQNLKQHIEPEELAPIYDIRTFEPRRAVGYLMHRVRAEMLAAVDRALEVDPMLAALEVSSAQYIILAQLGIAGSASASELCKGISYDAGAMTRMIDRLEDKGLLRRSRSPEDRRLVNLELTQQGTAALPRMRECTMGVLNGFLRGFSRTEANQLESFLTRMLANGSGTD